VKKMVVQTWTEVITSSLQTLWAGFIGFLPRLLGAVIIFLIGWLIAVVLAKLADQVIRVLRIDQILEKMGFKRSLEKANLKLNSGKFIGELVKWFFIIVFLMAATDILELFQVTEFLRRILLYIPHLIVAVLILLAAVLIANFLQKLVKAGVEAASLKGANFLSAVTKWAILVFAVLAALLQLGIVPALIQTIFTGFVAALAIAAGLAFGLGGKDLAAQVLGRIKKDVSE
jgi:small-conductance mechanosensitive channel